MDQKFQRILLVGIKSRRLYHESLNLLVIRAFEREGFRPPHVDLRQQRVVHVGNGFIANIRISSVACAFEVVFPNFVRSLTERRRSFGSRNGNSKGCRGNSASCIGNFRHISSPTNSKRRRWWYTVRVIIDSMSVKVSSFSPRFSG